MTERDWTLTDQADAEDADRDRKWWKRNPFDPNEQDTEAEIWTARQELQP